MATIHDVMPAFELFQPASIDDAVSLLQRHRRSVWALAGGLDTFDWLKDRNKRPSVVIDLSGIEPLRGIKALPDGGVEIGATTTLTEIANNAVIKEKFKVLADAAGLVASPQIRNQGTLEHALFDANRCVAVNPSDTAPALVALDAQMVIRNTDGERVVSAEEFFIGPAIDITRMTVMQPGDLLTSIRIPATWAGAKFYFEKVRDRQVWDFPLVNVATALKVSGGNIQESRVVVNAVAAHPMRLHAVEAAIKGKAQNEETASMAGELAIQGNQPLAHNAYKIPLMRNLVKRALRAEATS
jgi:xanthine dehydrogenase YagS FAD-binding subunit